MGAMTAKVLKNPLFTENVQAEEVLNSLVAIDFTEMQRRLAEYQPSMTIDPVTEQLEGCDPVIQVCTFTLTNEQLVNRLAILLETAMQVPVVQNFADLAADYDNLMQFMSQTTTEEYVPQEIDWAAQVRQQTMLYSDAQVTLYTDAQGQLVKLIVNYSALPDWAERMSEVEPTEGILKPVTFTLNRNTLADGLQYDWTLEKEENSTTGRLTIGEKNAELVLMPDDQTQTTISLTVEPNRRGGRVDVEVRTTSEANGTDSGIQFGVFTSGSSSSVYRESRIRLLSGGEVGLTIYTTTFSCKPRPLLSDGDVLDLGEISSARFNAYMLTFSTSVALRKFYGTGEGILFRDAFADLNRFWDSLPKVTDSGRTLTSLPEKNYTTYTHPVSLNDTTLVALKTDFDRPSRLVAVDSRTGRERRRTWTGLVSSRPTTDGQQIWWTEYRRSLLFPERVNSRLVVLAPGKKRPRTAPKLRNVLYPTPIGRSGALAWVEYTPDGHYTIVAEDSLRQRTAWPMPGFSEVHGLAWDNATERLYTLVTDDSGMWIGRIEPGEGLQAVTRGAYITLSDLRAADGKLYYGSIASGRDEAHCFDLGEGREYRLSTSTYGSFAPAPADSGAVWTTTYDRKGYRITRQENIEPIPVAPSQLPVDLVNPPRRRWNVVNLDTVRYTPADSASLHRKYPARRYRKGLHLLRAHSWAPVSFDPFKTIEEFNPRLMWGATVLSQNLLSSTEAFASWGWSRSDGHVLKGTIRYSGLGVRLEARATYGGDRMTYGIAQRGADGKAERQPAPAHAKYWSAAAGATLPLYFDRGHHIRQLSISAGWEYSNGMVADVDAIRYDAEGRIANLQTLGYREGLHKLSLGIGFSDVVRAAYRDVGTPWGYTLWAGYDLNPENRNFSDLVSAYARIYTPGFFRHNSLSVAAAYQTSVGGYRFPSGLRFLGYKSTRLLPRGFSSSDISSNNYLAGSVDYQFPLCYPEGGISGVIYFKRIRLNVGADYARFQEFGSRGKTWRDIYSYGGDLLLDLNILRMSAAATATVKLSLYKPSEGSCWFGFGLELPF